MAKKSSKAKGSKRASKPAARKAKPAAKPASGKAAKGAKGAAKSAAKSTAKAGGKAAAKAAAKAPAASKFNGRVNGNRPGKPGRGAPPPKIGRAARGRAGAAPAAKGASPAPKKPSRQRVRICKQEGCSTPQTTQGYCRLHYLQNWKALREEKAKRAQKNLDRYVERMAGVKKPAADDEETAEAGGKEDAVFEEDFGEFVDVLSREENLDKILNGIKVEDY